MRNCVDAFALELSAPGHELCYQDGRSSRCIKPALFSRFVSASRLIRAVTGEADVGREPSELAGSLPSAMPH